ncbi:enoyl-CoA hydratase/isomerase family protein [Alicyclobacillus vulcanalis]|uniref:Short chain enoyl-CoA hydratase n=2 Tax=Alicyclobacillus TaxID=29330 RepID=A0A1N7MHK7_9BACL|nr:enoyl-CoA hydratase-related protein [Alicyclobacillus vulcanalis]SIS85399.1 short chain enoyl-CoA hydratase [Alicyclobacillus vulcanalis]
MSYSTLQMERLDKGIVWVSIDNPPANAISDALVDDLDRLLTELEADQSARVLVIGSNHPKNFVAGADLKMMTQNASKFAGQGGAIRDAASRMQHVFDRIAKFPRPVVAAIHGHALGGGCELALACDFRFMSGGTIGLTEVSLGLIPGAGGTQRMTLLLGRAKAAELIFFAKRLSKEEAEAIGLITKAVEPDRLREEVLAFAQDLSERAVFAMGLAKQAMDAALPIDGGLRVEAENFERTFSTGEPLEGIAAFLQKRPAKFLKDTAAKA